MPVTFQGANDRATVIDIGATIGDQLPGWSVEFRSQAPHARARRDVCRDSSAVARSSGCGRIGPEHAVERISQRDIARITGKRRPHPAGDIRVSDSGERIGEAQRAAGTG